MPADDELGLGELSHDLPTAPSPAGWRQVASSRWRLIAVTAVLSLAVGAVAGQISARRVRDQLRPDQQTTPVLAWLSTESTSGSTQQQVIVHVANLTTRPIRIELVISRPGAMSRPVTATLPTAVSVGPAPAGSAVVDLIPQCGGPYTGAAIAVQVGYPDPLSPGTIRHVVVAVDKDPAVGPSYPSALDQVC